MNNSQIQINDLVHVIVEMKNPLVSERNKEVENTEFSLEQPEKMVQGGLSNFHNNVTSQQQKYPYDKFSHQKHSPRHTNKWEVSSRQYGKKGQFTFTIRPDLHGNDIKGPEWLEEQRRRHSFEKYSIGEKKNAQNQQLENHKIIYIEPSSAESQLNQLRKLGKPFEDIDFPSNKKSLLGDYGDDQNWEQIRWKKISASLPDSEIFKNKPEPMDIKQGYLGDCYFLAGLAALAETPHRICDLFLLKKKNQLNYYSVKILFRGKWRTINLDDSIPFLFSEPAFSKSVGKDLWVILLEKAWAKIYGSYKQIQAGFPEEPLHDLTGAPIHHLYLKHRSFNPQKEWSYLLKASKLEYSMVASSRAGSDRQKSSSGVVQGHAYTFLNADQLHIGNITEKIVQLRNPWGDVEFTGKWSDYDSNWNFVSEKQKQRLGFNPNEKDGTFFMSYADFLYQFRTLSVAQTNDNASYVYRSYHDPNVKGVYFKVDIKKAGVYSFQVDNTPERSFTGQKQTSYSYPEIWLQLGKIQSTFTKKLQGKISHRRTLFKKYDLTPGVYISWVKISFNPEFEEDFEVTLAVYSEYTCGVDIASKVDAIRFRGDKNVDWEVEEACLSRRESSHLGKVSSSNRFKKKLPSQLANSKENKKKEESQRQKKIDPNPHDSSENSKIAPFISSELVPSDGIKIRKIKIVTEEESTIEESPNGEIKIVSTTIQNKKQTLGAISTAGEDMLMMIRKSQKKTEGVENQFNGQTIKKTENYKQVIETKQKTPDGEMVDRREEKEGQLEALEQEDQLSERQQQNNHEQEKFKLNSPRMEQNYPQQEDINSEDERRIREEMTRNIFGQGKNKFTVLLQPSQSASESGY